MLKKLIALFAILSVTGIGVADTCPAPHDLQHAITQDQWRPLFRKQNVDDLNFEMATIFQDGPQGYYRSVSCSYSNANGDQVHLISPIDHYYRVEALDTHWDGGQYSTIRFCRGELNNCVFYKN